MNKAIALEYREDMKKIAELKQRKAIKMIELIAEHTTASKAELYYNATEDGLELIKLEYYSKGLIELMRSVKTECDLKNAEAHGQY